MGPNKRMKKQKSNDHGEAALSERRRRETEKKKKRRKVLCETEKALFSSQETKVISCHLDVMS